MSSKWIIYGLLAVALLIIMNLFGPFKGSTNSDFPDEFQPRDSNPLPECPGSPNCVRLSVPISANAGQLFDVTLQALREMTPEEITPDQTKGSIDAVFRIPVFGFRDDMNVSITGNASSDQSILHISSRSRTGQGDLGVNRRRVKGFIDTVQSNI